MIYVTTFLNKKNMLRDITFNSSYLSVSFVT